MDWRLYQSSCSLPKKQPHRKQRKITGGVHLPQAQHKSNEGFHCITPTTLELEQQRHVANLGSATQLIALKPVMVKRLGPCHQG